MEPAAVRGQPEAAEPHPPAHDVQHGERPALLRRYDTLFTLHSSLALQSTYRSNMQFAVSYVLQTQPTLLCIPTSPDQGKPA